MLVEVSSDKVGIVFRAGDGTYTNKITVVSSESRLDERIQSIEVMHVSGGFVPGTPP
jgi:hypothetical protein